MKVETAFVLVCIACLCSLSLVASIGPYPVAGPKAAQAIHRPPAPEVVLETTPQPAAPQAEAAAEKKKKEIGAGRGPVVEAAKKEKEIPESVWTPEQEASAITGLSPEPQSEAQGRETQMDYVITHPISTVPGAAGAANPALASGKEATRKIMSSPVVATSMALVHACFIGPMIWLCYAGRSALMRSWYGCLIPTAIIFFTSFGLFLDVAFLPLIGSMWVAKIVAASTGGLLFFRPSYGWVATILTTSLILAQLVSAVLFSPPVPPPITAINPLAPPPAAPTVATSHPGFLTTTIIGVSLVFLEMQFPDGGQALIASTAAGFFIISSVSFLSLFFGLTSSSPFDAVSYWHLNFDVLRESPIMTYTFLGVWVVLAISGMALQLFRTKQGYTVGFPSTVSIILAVKEEVPRR